MEEKRKFPRIDKVLSIKFSDKEFDILTETKNISASGAYCPVNKPVELMTKLNLVLLIPMKKSRAKTIKKINCSGVVVRHEYTKDNGNYPYRIGIYFTDLKETDRKILRNYINSSLKS
ncbi:MAG: PilZ domain-containing protein [Candidatus Omnitrophica bacterium]|nr:PilZ domain-containing protein [Candidatus Omnitrophota bacterium]MDD5429730.1 PilZ domain-containing protein [Candidatus Omnitrophota bacterium]